MTARSRPKAEASSARKRTKLERQWYIQWEGVQYARITLGTRTQYLKRARTPARISRSTGRFVRVAFDQLPPGLQQTIRRERTRRIQEEGPEVHGQYMNVVYGKMPNETTVYRRLLNGTWSVVEEPPSEVCRILAAKEVSFIRSP